MKSKALKTKPKKKTWHVWMSISIAECGPGVVAVLLVDAENARDAATTATNLWAAANPLGTGCIVVMQKPRRVKPGDEPFIPNGFVDPIAFAEQSESKAKVELATPINPPPSPAIDLDCSAPTPCPPAPVEPAVAEKLPPAPVLPVPPESLVSDPMPLLDGRDAARRILADAGQLAAAEDMNALCLVYLISLSRLTDRPLWGMVTGSTGSGKSSLASVAINCTPTDDRIDATSKTNEALIEMAASQPDGVFDLRGKLIAGDERKADAKDPTYLRSLYEDQKATKLKASPMGTLTMTLSGCPSMLETSTSPRMFGEDENRRITVMVDESASKAKMILSRVADRHAGYISGVDPAPIHARHQCLQGILPRRATIHVPFANDAIPPVVAAVSDGAVFRRYEQLIALTKTIALLGYRTRTNAGGVIIADTDDYALAYELLGPAMQSAAAGVSQAARATAHGLNDALAALPTTDGRRKGGFTRADIQSWTGTAKSSIERHVEELVDARALVVLRVGGRGKMHVYRLDPDWKARLNGDFGFVRPEILKARVASANAQAGWANSGHELGMTLEGSAPDTKEDDDGVASAA